MKYMFQYMWNLRGGAHAQMTFGNVMHTTIKECVGEIRKAPQHAASKKCSPIYEREWSAAGFIDDYHEQEYRKAGREQLEAFHRSYSLRPPNVLHQEKSLRAAARSRSGGHRPHRPDQSHRARREVEIVDYKTGKPRDAKKADEDLQLSVYALAAQEVLGPRSEPARFLQSRHQRSHSLRRATQKRSLPPNKNRGSRRPDSRRRILAEAQALPAAIAITSHLCPAHEQLINIQSAQRTSNPPNVRAQADKITRAKKSGATELPSPRFFYSKASQSSKPGSVPRMNYSGTSPRESTHHMFALDIASFIYKCRED